MIKFPEHKAGLTLSHNDHKGIYETVAQSILRGRPGYTENCWTSPEQMQEAEATNECWTLQWYPSTPVGFHIASAATLEALLEYCNDPNKRWT